MAKDGRPMTLKEIQEKIKDGSVKIVFETDGVTKDLKCTRCGSIFSTTFFLKKLDPKDGICPTCRTGKYLKWNIKDKKKDS